MSLLSNMMTRRRRDPSPETPWTLSSTYIARGFRFITADASVFMASTPNSIYTASGPSGTWSLSSNTPGSTLYYFLSNCNSNWVAGKSSGNISYATSSTGTWTGVAVGSVYHRGCIYSSTASLYILIGDSGSLYTATSLGGIWTSRTSQFGTDAIYAIHDNGSLIVAVGAAGKMSTSTNGTTWTSRTSGFGTTSIKGVVYGGTTWVLSGLSDKIGTSSDPTSSVTINSSTGITAGSRFSNCTYSGTTFVIAGSTSGGGKAFESSTPAGSWTTRDLNVVSSDMNVASNSSYFGMVSRARYIAGFGRTV